MSLCTRRLRDGKVLRQSQHLEESCDVMSELGLIEVKDEILGKT